VFSGLFFLEHHIGRVFIDAVILSILIYPILRYFVNRPIRLRIEELLLAERALRENVTRFRMLTEAALVGVYIIQDGKFRYVNPSFAQTFGYEIDEIVDKLGPFDLTYPEDRDLVLENVQRRIKGEVERVHYTFRGQRKDGTIIYCEVLGRRVEYLQRPAIIGTLLDVTERRKLEEQLRQAQKMEAIGTLAGGIAHDFNNLLTVINGYAEILAMKMKKGSPYYKDIQSILTAGERAKNLTNKLLAFSRKQVYDPRVIDINQVILNLEKMLLRLIGEDISIETVLTPDIPKILADPNQIEQLLMNLIVNARDAINEKTDKAAEKKITIETRHAQLSESYVSLHPGDQEGSYVVISVSDTGIGMDEETKSKIFEPFFTTKKMGKGTGLGLSTVYGIVKQNKGSIHVYSEPGEGTTFKIYWPVLDKELPNKIERTEPALLNGSENILLVEDDEGVRSFTSVALRELGYTVHEAANGIKALELVKSKKLNLDLLITDIIMPRMNGKELAEKVIELVPSVRVLYISGYTDNHIAHHGALKKGIDFVQKPYSIKILSRKVRDVLDRK